MPSIIGCANNLKEIKLIDIIFIKNFVLRSAMWQFWLIDGHFYQYLKSFGVQRDGKWEMKNASFAYVSVFMYVNAYVYAYRLLHVCVPTAFIKIILFIEKNHRRIDKEEDSLP